jgi:uncharacterized protein (TIGR03083 family)
VLWSTVGMDPHRYLDCLDSDYARFREVVVLDRGAAVPTCPEWTVDDLTSHLAHVYLHKVACIRDGAAPDPWPTPGLAEEDPVDLLDRGFADLRGELVSHRPQDFAASWYTPDQTVGFWYRRMAQETVVHRIDAELAAGQPVTSVPDDLAVDGVDELVSTFVPFGLQGWPEYFAEVLGGSPGYLIELRAGETVWCVQTGPGRFAVTTGPAAGAADLTVSGGPEEMLRWVWSRETPGVPSPVRVDGSAEALAELRACLQESTD